MGSPALSASWYSCSSSVSSRTHQSAKETNDGKPCIVSVVVFLLLVWYWRPDDNGVEKWMIYGQDVSFAD
jgi:hypothetical protein